ncbi:MAG TPA: CYTH and CHAD domain-containing protein [Pseudonocardiaceae bacterium]|jgi:CHAD domain-containing protein|nr:CYTH and CHAD domain-containing protein [Pseudonocardiaceae bacterium]
MTASPLERTDDVFRLRPDVFADLPGVADVTGPDRRSSDVTYYDTADMRLTGARIALYRDEGDQDEGWHADVSAGGHGSAVHVPLSRAPGAIPDGLASLVSAYTMDRPLRRCRHIAKEREVWRLVDRDGDVLAEVAETVARTQELGDHEGPVRTSHQVGIELGRDDSDLLALVRERLVDAGAPPSTTDPEPSAAQENPAAPRLRGRSSAADVVTAYLRTQVDGMRTADVAVRLDEPDGVHDLRVAVRRVSSVLRVCRPILVATRVRLLARELKWISDLLGAARDTEVLGAQLDDWMRSLPTELVLGPVMTHVDRYLARPTADAAEALRKAMAGQRYRSLLESLDTLLAEPPYRDAAQRRAKDVLPPLVAKAYRKAGKAARSARRMTPGPEQDAALHLARRRAKRLRYAVETVEPVIGKPARRLRRRVRDMQSLLGDQHDLVVLRPVLRELGARAYREQANGFTFGLVHGQADERARDMAKRFPRQWHRATRHKHTNWLRGVK